MTAADEEFLMTDMTGMEWGFAFLVAVIAVILGVVAPAVSKQLKSKRVTVYEGFVGLLVRKGRIEKVHGPGEYSTAFTDDKIDVYDLREQSMQVAGQEVITKDLLPVRVSLTLRWRVTDPKAYRMGHTNPVSVIYEEAQNELRRRIASMALEDLLADREKLVEGFAEHLAASAAVVGSAVNGVALRDLTLAGPARSAYADIWKAKKEGEAALERARGEQAALRSLANAARMLKGNPELMNLRLLQTLNGGPGKTAPTVVLGGGAGLLPVQAGEPGAETGEA